MHDMNPSLPGALEKTLLASSPQPLPTPWRISSACVFATSRSQPRKWIEPSWINSLATMTGKANREGRHKTSLPTLSLPLPSLAHHDL